jgi:hypothetical protein
MEGIMLITKKEPGPGNSRRCTIVAVVSFVTVILGVAAGAVGYMASSRDAVRIREHIILGPAFQGEIWFRGGALTVFSAQEARSPGTITFSCLKSVPTMRTIGFFTVYDSSGWEETRLDRSTGSFVPLTEAADKGK